MKKIIKLHKSKFTLLYTSAKANDLSLTQVRQMSLGKHQRNRDRQILRKEGLYLDWPNRLFDGFMLRVPVYTKQTHREVGYQVYMSKAEIPAPYKCLWPVSA